MRELRNIRLRQGLSQADLSERTGVAEHTISEVEAGKRTPRPSTLRKLAQGLGVEVGDLYGEPESPKVQEPSPKLTAGVSVELQWRVFSNFDQAARDVLEAAGETTAEQRRAVEKMRRRLDQIDREVDLASQRS